MPKSFKLPVKWGGSLPSKWREPRFLLRGVIGVLLAMNLAAAVVAFKPFGGGAEDLEQQEAALTQQISTMHKRVEDNKALVEKMRNARMDRDQFLAKYVADARLGASTLAAEIDRIATASGVRLLPVSFNEQEIEGSDTFRMVTVTAALEGNYISLAKFINMVDKSPHFLIIESLETEAPQQNGALLNIRLKIDTFVNGTESNP